VYNCDHQSCRRFEGPKDLLYQGEGDGLAVSGDFLYERKDLLLSRDWRGFERLMVSVLYCRADDNVSIAHYVLLISSLATFSVTELYLLCSKYLQVVRGSRS